jgi:hypothetical protein
MRWYWIRFTDHQYGHHVIGHTVPESLLDYVLQDLAVRGHIPEHIEEVTETFLDRPGYYIIGTPEEVFEIDDLKVNIPTCYVGLLQYDLKNSAVRDECWVKLHTWRNCLCLHRYQHAVLLGHMLLRDKVANEKYDKFMAEWEKKHKGVSYV